MHGLILAAALLAIDATQSAGISAPAPAQNSVVQLPQPDPNAPPVIDVALRIIRAATGGSSLARSAVRGDEVASVYFGLGPCVIGSAASDPARENSLAWRASGRIRSVERGIAIADVEWQRLEYRPSGVTAGSRVRTTLTLPLGERVAVDVVETPGSVCRADGLVFEIGVAPDHGRRLAMSSEGRPITGTTGAGGGAGRRLTTEEMEAQAERQRQAAAAIQAAPVVTRRMPPREYAIDAWLVPGSTPAATPAMVQRMSQMIGGTGGRFSFPPATTAVPDGRVVAVDISALVIPAGGDHLVIAITRHVALADGTAAVSSGWLRIVRMPTPGDVLSLEIPVPEADVSPIVPRQAYGLRVKIEARGK